jgi:hypothetical protein
MKSPTLFIKKNPSHPSTKLKISKGGTDNEKESTCPYAKMKKSKWGSDKNEKKPISSQYENENLKRGKDKNTNPKYNQKYNQKYSKTNQPKKTLPIEHNIMNSPTLFIIRVRMKRIVTYRILTLRPACSHP